MNLAEQKTEAVASEAGIQSAYSQSKTAIGYVQQRFSSELFRLLHDRQVSVVNRLITETCAAQVLEIACGPGRVTRDIRLSPEHLTCLEFNVEMLRVARQACDQGIHWIRGNAFALPLAQQFDLVYSFRFIRHFHHPDRDRLYQQIRSVLKPGGWLVMDAVNAAVSAPLRAASPAEYPIYDKLYDSEAALQKELEAAGFEVKSIEPVQRWFAAQSRAQILLGPRSQLLCRWAVQGLEKIRRGPALEWIVTCRRA
jgi:ubiquinone/menaquinone biosynthesis C-methylase UbiE